MQHGYIAFVSAVVISALLLLIAAAGSVRGWYVRSNVLDREYKLQSEALARGCIDQVLLYMAKDTSFAGSTTIMFEEGICVVNRIRPIAPYKEFILQTTYHNAYTTLRVVVDETPAVVSWEEISTYN